MPTSYEEGIVEHHAQPAEGVADGGLSQIEAAASSAYSSFGVNRVKDDKEVQIDVFYMHGID